MSCLETVGERGKLGTVTDFVRQAARNAAFDEEDLLRVDLIVEEIFLNIAMHGYKDQPGPVAIHCASPGPGRLTIQSQDWAGPFNPLAGENVRIDVPLSERREGGMGLQLVKTMANSVAYERVEDRNELTVRIVARDQISG